MNKKRHRTIEDKKRARVFRVRNEFKKRGIIL